MQLLGYKKCLESFSRLNHLNLFGLLCCNMNADTYGWTWVSFNLEYVICATLIFNISVAFLSIILIINFFVFAARCFQNFLHKLCTLSLHLMNCGYLMRRNGMFFLNSSAEWY